MSRHLLAPLAVAVLSLAADDPEPLPFGGKEEQAAPAVDLDKAKDDRELARKADANRALSAKNLVRIGIAAHNYHDAYATLPDDVTDKNGKALLSWRVRILPYLDQQALYREFKLDEAWDSAHNKKLLARMPAVFASPRVALKGKGNTVYQGFHGADGGFGRGQALRLTSITDGTSNTIMAAETSVGVPWTRPGGVAFNRKAALPDLGKAYGKRPLVVMYDGATRLLDLEKLTAATLTNAICPNDGMVLGGDW